MTVADQTSPVGGMMPSQAKALRFETASKDGTQETPKSVIRRRKLMPSTTVSLLQPWTSHPAALLGPSSEDDEPLRDLSGSTQSPNRGQRVTRARNASKLGRPIESCRSLSSSDSSDDSDFMLNSSSDCDISDSESPGLRPGRRSRSPTKFAKQSITSKPSSNASVLVSDNRKDLKSSLSEPDKAAKVSTKERPCTPPSDAQTIPRRTLTSPTKLPRIPHTPQNRPSIDTFWNRHFVDDWNEMHTSPKKLFAAADRLHSPVKSSQAVKTSRLACSREEKRAFERRKHGLADDFLRELDENVTSGKIGMMTEASGGVAVRWTNKLNTTAGRAIWKRETIRSRTTEDESHNQDGAASVKHVHHAAIEIAEKVIDDEYRLLNVMAHEFCHLATFIIDGVSTNPHGKEFKAWASKCTAAFAPRGVQVTTKHSYDIAYKYIWACADCATEYKRHSKSIDVERHRCGSCKGELKQIKPTPRTPAKASDYHTFMKEQMRVLKKENPGSPQKEIMKMVAGEWSRRSAAVAANDQIRPGDDTKKPDGLTEIMKRLQLGRDTTP